MHTALRSAGLRFVYARYAKAKGWNDHPMAVRQRVELFNELGTGPVAEALADFHIARRRWSTRFARGVVAAGIVSIATYAAYHASPAAAEVSKPSTVRPARSVEIEAPKVVEGTYPVQDSNLKPAD